jgi:Uncharacterized protein conserved in cyanobacteria
MEGRVMGQAAIEKGQRYTYVDYMKWNDEQRWELIEGFAVNMTPSPSRLHQKILGDLHNQFYNYLKGKPCEVYGAPFDVRFPGVNEGDEDIDTVLQPDLSVICDPGKLDDRGCKGAPDLVIEVLSPETAKRDLTVKLSTYEKSGVREYWVVHPGDKTVMIFSLSETGEYGKPKVYAEKDEIPVNLFQDLVIYLGSVFA